MRPLLPFFAFVFALGTSPGCIGRVLPIPPPGGSVFSDVCEPSTCPDGGARVTVRGVARAGAWVIVEDPSRLRPDGTVFSSAVNARTEADVAAGRATQVGEYELCLCPETSSTGVVTAARPGDRITVVQLVETVDGLMRSEALELVVPTP